MPSATLTGLIAVWANAQASVVFPPTDYDDVGSPLAAQELAAHFDRMDRLLPIAVELGQLQALDQYARTSLIRAFDSFEDDPEASEQYRAAVADHLDAIDEHTTERLKDILKNVSWTELAQERQYLWRPAMHIVRHSGDRDFQRRALIDIQPLAESGTIPGADFAKLTDKFLLQDSGFQRYGTQLDCIEGKRQPLRLSDPEGVDERRATVGLEPLATYIDLVDASQPACPR